MWDDLEAPGFPKMSSISWSSIDTPRGSEHHPHLGAADQLSSPCLRGSLIVHVNTTLGHPKPLNMHVLSVQSNVNWFLWLALLIEYYSSKQSYFSNNVSMGPDQLLGHLPCTWQAPVSSPRISYHYPEHHQE